MLKFKGQRIAFGTHTMTLQDNNHFMINIWHLYSNYD